VECEKEEYSSLRGDSISYPAILNFSEQLAQSIIVGILYSGPGSSPPACKTMMEDAPSFGDSGGFIGFPESGYFRSVSVRLTH